MWNIILLAIIIIFVLMYKGRVTDFFKRLKSNTKVTYRPNYRKYNPMITLSEQVHFEVIPTFGITAEIIRENYNSVMELMLRDKQETISVSNLEAVYHRNVEKEFEHYYLFALFFKQIGETNKYKYPLHEVMVAIKFGL